VSAPVPASVRVTVTVAVDPATAFDVFTGEIEQWYRRGVASMGGPAADPGRTLRFEPGVGGRLLEVDPGDPAHEPVERARVTVWEPGRRLVFVDRRDTEVEVVFAGEADPGARPDADGPVTRVVLEHRGLDRVPPEVAARLAKYGWRRLAEWFEQHQQIRRR
jgi:hypothetical protein